MNAVVNFNEEQEQTQIRGELIAIEAPKPNIYQRLNAVMQEVKYIQKGQNRVNNTYRFVSHDQVVSVLHEPLTNNGIVMTTSVIEHTCEEVRTIGKTGQEVFSLRTTVKLAITFINMDNPADKFETYHMGYGIDNSDKGIGKAISYAVKYALLKTFCLETGDDPDDDQVTKQAPRNEAEALTIGQINAFMAETGNSNLAKKYIAFLAASTNMPYEEQLLRAMKNKASFDKNFIDWQRKQESASV